MKVVIDMNLSPTWVPLFKAEGHDAKHWIEIGSPAEKDRVIFRWAQDHGYVVFTHDLDFGSILASTQASAPSVIQIRTQDPTPARCSTLIFTVITNFTRELEQGALITIDEKKSRLTLLPLNAKVDE